MKSTIQFNTTFCCAVLCLSGLTSAFAQNQTPLPNAGHISETLKTAFYPGVLYPHGIVPDWDRGYLIHHEIETNYSPDTPMVQMYDGDGVRIREGRIWPKGAATVTIRRTASTHEGAILAAGRVVMQDGSVQGYIAKTDLTGNTIQTVFTGGFRTEQLCEASDGSIWSLGRSIGPDGKAEHDANILRHFSFERGLLHGFLPQSTVEALVRSKTPWFTPFGSYVQCGKTKVSAYLEFTKEYAEVDTSTFELNRWNLDLPLTQRREGDGLAVTEDGKVYLGLQVFGMPGRSPFRGLYQLRAVPGQPVAELLPVSGAMSFLEPNKVPPSESFVMLWGADGNQLVVWRVEGNGSMLSWVNVIHSGSTD